VIRRRRLALESDAISLPAAMTAGRRGGLIETPNQEVSMSRPYPSSIAPIAAAAAAVAMGLLALQYVVARPSEDALREFLVVTAMIAVATGIVFGLVIPRALAKGGSAGIALTLSLLGLLLAAAYWSGVPPVLAIGGVVLALRSGEGARAGLSRVALVVGALALVFDVVALVVDAAMGA
jgi:CBS domain containing-hemolysin-like protein